MSQSRLLALSLLTLVLQGCATTECFKGDALYEGSNSDCFRYCADPGCKYWGYTRDDAEEALSEARLAAEGEAKKQCRSLGLVEGSKDFNACTRRWLLDRNMIEIKQQGNQRMTPSTYYFEK